MSKDLSDNIVELNEAVKNYVQTKLDLVKLSLLERITKFILYVITIQIAILFIFLIITFLATAFVFWYEQTFQSIFIGLLIALGFILILGLLFFIFQKKLITKNLIKNFSEILFSEDEK